MTDLTTNTEKKIERDQTVTTKNASAASTINEAVVHAAEVRTDTNATTANVTAARTTVTETATTTTTRTAATPNTAVAANPLAGMNKETNFTSSTVRLGRARSSTNSH